MELMNPNRAALRKLFLSVTWTRGVSLPFPGPDNSFYSLEPRYYLVS